MDVPTNGFKRRLLAGDVQYGVFCALADSVAAEIVAGAGFDWMLLDGEHAPNDLRTILAQLQAVAGSGTEVLVRPEVGDTVTIKRLLDIGAQSLLVPMVETAAHAADLVAAVRYPPAGVRGVGTSMARAARWNRVRDYLQSADREVCLVVQIESVAGLGAIEAIAAVDGVDALFVGPSDLAASMGHRGQPGHAEVQAGVDDALRRIVAAGKPAGVFASTPESVQRWTGLGASVIALGADISLLVAALDALAARHCGRPRDRTIEKTAE
jgi:4-hydroxy-2-oxoheptanedioate aldolase